MNKIASTGVDESTLIERAKALVPKLRERAAHTEQLGKVDPRTIDDFQTAGFFRMFQSRHWGGYESHPSAIFRVQEILAQGCMSSAWVMGVVGVHNWQLAHFSKRAQEEVWGSNSSVLASSSYAPTGTVEPVEGGCILRGRWFYSSGADYGDWVLLGGNIVDPAGALPDYRTYLVPRSDYKVIDDWNVMGLKGTGSKGIEVKEAFVPDHRQLPMMASQTFNTPGLQDGMADAPLFLVPFPTIFGACITTPALGAAQGILDAYVEMTRKAASVYTGERWADEQITQMRMAESDAQIRGARLQLKANFDAVMDSLATDGELTLEQRAQFRFDHCNLVEQAFRAADRLFVASGARSLLTSGSLQRHYRDILGARVHAINNRSKWGPIAGKAQLGEFGADLSSLFI